MSSKIKQIIKEEVTLKELTSFEWDEIYIFPLYISKNELEEKLGFKSKYICEGLNDGINAIHFVKDKEIVSLTYSSKKG